MDQHLVATLHATLNAKPTADLRQAYEGGNQAVWSPEAFEAMRQILSERGEAGLRHPDLTPPPPSEEPARKMPPEPGWQWTLAGLLAGLLIIPVGLFGGQFGKIMLGSFGMAVLGVLWLIYVISILPIPFVRLDDEHSQPTAGGRRLYVFFMGLGVIAGVVGMIVGAIMAGRGELFEWWIWPLAALSSCALGAWLGSWTYRLWSRRPDRKR